VQDKQAVNYRISEEESKCNLCTNWTPPNGCKQVDGEISEDAVCDLFDMNQEANIGDMVGPTFG
jgi:hypothetical protein